MKISPNVASFIKGALGVLVAALVSYLASSANLTGLLNPTLAVVVAGFFAMLETQLKANSGGTTALFGAARIK